MKHAFDIVHLLTDSNPIQVLVDAIINRWALLDVSVAAPHTSGAGMRIGCQHTGLIWAAWHLLHCTCCPPSQGKVMPSAAGVAVTVLQALGRGCLQEIWCDMSSL